VDEKNEVHEVDFYQGKFSQEKKGVQGLSRVSTNDSRVSVKREDELDVKEKKLVESPQGKREEAGTKPAKETGKGRPLGNANGKVIRRGQIDSRARHGEIKKNWHRQNQFKTQRLWKK